MMKNIALLIPCYNNRDGLFKSLLSIDEDFLNPTVYVINDGSDFLLNDKDFSSYQFDVVLTNNAINLGIEHSLKLGVERISDDGFEYFARLDCGDTQVKNRLYKQLNYLKDNPSVAVVGSYANAVDPVTSEVVFELRNPIEYEAIQRRLLSTCCLCHPTIAARVKCVIDVGNYRKKYQCAEDYDLYLRIAQAHEITNIPEFLVNYEFAQNESFISIGRRPEQLKSRLKLQLSYFDVFSIASYYGVIKSVLLMIIPYKYIVTLKERVLS